MNGETTTGREMGVFGKIIGIFTSPRETFESIDRKPSWLVPFIINLVFVVVLQYLVMDIAIKDRVAIMRAKNVPAEQMEVMESRMQGPMKYAGMIVGPVATLIVWAILAGILLFGGNTIMGGETRYKKVFSVVAWSSLVGLVGGILKTFLILSKGTTRGVVTSLAVLLPTPPLGHKASVLYRFLSKFDLFTIWNLILWIIGLAVIYRFTTKKSSTLVLSLWAIWIVISITLGSILTVGFGG